MLCQPHFLNIIYFLYIVRPHTFYVLLLKTQTHVQQNASLLFSTFQGQFGYGGADDSWVNGGVPFSTGAPPTTTHNNNAYYVQVSI